MCGLCALMNESKGSATTAVDTIKFTMCSRVGAQSKLCDVTVIIIIIIIIGSEAQRTRNAHCIVLHFL